MSTIYDYITIDNPSGGTSTTYSGTEISVNTPAISDVTKAEVTLTAKQSLNGYSAPWADGTGINQMTGSNRMRDWEITGSGDIVNFYPYQMSASSPFNLSRLSTDIVPQQDLNGYDHPWAGGAGKNLLQPDTLQRSGGTAITATIDSSGVITINGTAESNTFIGYSRSFVAGSYIINGCPSGGGTSNYQLQARQSTITGTNLGTDTGEGKSFTLSATTTVWATIRIASGYTANNLKFYPMIRLSSESDPTWQPYENICPITGFSSASVTRAGKNLLLYPYQDTTKTTNGITFTVNGDGTITVNGTATATAWFTIAVLQKSFASDVILSGAPTGSTTDTRIQANVNGSTKYDTGSGISVSAGQTIDTIYIRISSGQTVNNLIFKPMIRLSTESATYEPYNGDTYTVSFGSAGTVYGGTLDVVSGQLTVTHKVVTFTSATVSSVSNPNGKPFYITVTDQANKVGLLTDSYKYLPDNTQHASIKRDEFICTQSGTNWIWRFVAPSTVTSQSDLNTWITANPIQAYYPLATPLTYQLTATQVAMITGNNYIWTNCGTITDAGYKLTSSNNDSLTYLYAPNAGLCTGKMPTTIGLGFTYNYLSFEYYSTQAVDIDVYICGTDAKWYDTTYNRTKYVKWDTFSLPAKTSYTKYTLPTRSISLSDLTQGAGDVNSVYFEIVPTTNSPTYPMRIQRVQVDHNSASTSYVPSQNRCTYSGTSSVTLYKRASSGGTYQSSYYKYLNSTVYNGSFEYITGKVTKTYASITLNSSDLTWSVYNDSSTSRAFRATISDMKSLSHSSYDSVRCFCTHAGWTSSSERLGFGNFYYSYGYVYFPDYSSKRFNTVDEFTAWLDLQESRGTPVTILYPLSTPTETTLPTTTIKTLAGQNYFDTSSTASSRLPLTMTIRQTSFALPRPANFNVQREDIYAGEYVTCTGATKADRIGWKYSDLDLEWDALEQGYVEALIALTGQATLIFDDPEHDTIQESIVRSSAVATRHRSTLNGVYWWTDVKCSIRFIDAHND